MARTRTPPPPQNPDDNDKNALTASAISAAAFNLTDPPLMADQYGMRVVDTMINSEGQGADRLAWDYYHRLSELHYLVSYVGNALSQVRLFVGQLDSADPDNPVEVGPRHPARELMRNFAGGSQGQSEIMGKLGLHLTVTGDAILIGPDPGAEGLLDFPFNSHRVFSTSEVSSRNGQIFLQSRSAFREIPVPPDATAIRIWKSDPQYWDIADSPVKSAFSVLSEIDLLDKHVRSSSLSRLAGAGILLIPEEITLPGGEVETEGLEADPFVKVLSEIMALAIKNQGSAAARVPIILRGPAEYLQALQHMDFSTSFDEKVDVLRETALRRLALGLDAPPEILLGSSESSSWSMWQVSESVLRIHLKPLAHLIASALTEGWLIPALKQLPLAPQTLESLEHIVVWPDFSQLRISVDPSTDAAALYSENLIDGQTYRHMLGFGEDEAPTEKELEFQILLQIIKTNPQLAPWALEALRSDFGIPFPDVDLMVGQDEKAVGLPGVGTPSAQTTPGTAPTIPGDRSRAKQTQPPPKPLADGDNNNNTPGGAS